MASAGTGRLVQIIGAVVDVEFEGALPSILNALETKNTDPRNGQEVMWNHRLHYMGRAVTFKFEGWLVDSAGQRVQTSAALSRWEFPIFDPKRTEPLRQDEPLFQWRLDYTGPQRRAGEGMQPGLRHAAHGASLGWATRTDLSPERCKAHPARA